MAAANRSGAITQTEAYAIHRELLAKKGQDYDPIARAVIERGRGVSAADYVVLLRERARLVRAMDLRLEDVDAIVLPTAKRVAPKISEVSTLEGVLAQQALFGSNTLWVSFFSLCAISVPLPREGGLPVGLMLVARNGHDRRLFRIAAAVERLFTA
jgi:aspartyl-tRNA(Asn)/glutamyl-tRNA(Gln) amidotransferase subunit A